MADGSQKVQFKQETISKLLNLHFKDEKTKVSTDAAIMASEVTRIFVAEAILRSSKRAQNESSNIINIDHFEKILPQLLLDF
ncbi:centromere protein X-like [Lineus longissimus]|uniref:centromere protein X-like n=1 Tax=Lineus longissimus TaxID=88925 RepID=UPI00315DE4FF